MTFNQISEIFCFRLLSNRLTFMTDTMGRPTWPDADLQYQITEIKNGYVYCSNVRYPGTVCNFHRIEIDADDSRYVIN